MGIPEKNRFIQVSPSLNEIKETYLKLLKIQKDAEKPFLIFVYFGGHGATDIEKQVFLLNHSDPKEVIFNVEYKMRRLANMPFSSARICCVFDCCRVPLSNMKGLIAGRGGPP